MEQAQSTAKVQGPVAQGEAGASDISKTNQSSGNRNEMAFYSAGFPQLAIIGYGNVNTVGGTTAKFDELASPPYSAVVHQPNYEYSAAWSVTRGGVGTYTLTHNLGNKKYIPMLVNNYTTGNGQTLMCTVADNSITIYSRDAASGALADVYGFGFIIFAIP